MLEGKQYSLIDGPFEGQLIWLRYPSTLIFQAKGFRGYYHQGWWVELPK